VAWKVAEGMTVVANDGVNVATTGIVSPLASVVVYVKGVGKPAAPVGPGCPTGPWPPGFGFAGGIVWMVWVVLSPRPSPIMTSTTVSPAGSTVVTVVVTVVGIIVEMMIVVGT